MNYYEVLGCNKDCTDEEIKRAYRRRLLQLHPDKSGATDSHEFQNVKEAWRILGYPESRRQYDATCKQEELEDTESPVFMRISQSDLEGCDEDTLFYRCRCGDCYFVERDHLRKKNTLLQVMCDGCTLTIIVET
ncbi:diphthamide biosynthesis protein 4-like [Nylanderia fulva]|uniref:diphthamide biosynthesis protein 4-like n=1 Tax=Nylanderia fulva TaxID=613905 RepID=UPI0010FBBDC9|nr:diphthamide biosynthesis protein 4-like [Nylanderia fulva]XP_029177242.1 diphthamide biosynthesis protein 4-like [Nylanderia fulva]